MNNKIDESQWCFDDGMTYRIKGAKLCKNGFLRHIYLVIKEVYHPSSFGRDIGAYLEVI